MTSAPYASHLYARPEKFLIIRESAEDSAKALNRPGIWTGEPIDPVDAPVSLYCETKRLGRAKLPHFLFTGEDTLVSKLFIQQLVGFDIGDVMFYPVTIYAFDMERVVSSAYSVMRIGNVKNGLIPEKSKGLIGNESRPGFFLNNYEYGGGDVQPNFSVIALAESALEGPEMWIDQNLTGAVFLGEKLATALTDAGFGDCLCMTQCDLF